MKFIPSEEPGLCYSPYASLLFRAYGFRGMRKLVLRLVGRSEKGAFYSGTLRAILKEYHGVGVGAYSYGECLQAGMFPRGVSLGRYCSVAAGVKVFLRNHPMDHLSTHPFFYNSELGVVPEDVVEYSTLEIGHDCWIGERVMITSSCDRIGTGSVIGAGSVVTKDVPEFAIVAGVPAKIVRYRFGEAVQASILESRWWDRTIEECSDCIEWMTRPFEGEASGHPPLEA